MNTALFAALSLVLLALLIGSLWLSRYFWLLEEEDELEQLLPPSEAVLAKQARDTVVRQTVMLASELARVDGFIAPAEMDAIRDFIVENVKRADQTFAARMMREGLEQPASPSTIREGLEEIRGIADGEQRALVLDFLIYVARSDGVVVPEESSFLLKAATALGFEETWLQARLEST